MKKNWVAGFRQCLGYVRGAGGDVSKLLGVIDKNSRERLEIRLAEYEGHKYVDVRTFWKGKDGDPWRPSKKKV